MVTIAAQLGLLVSCLAAGEPQPQRFEYRQVHMASEFKLILYTIDEPTARRASDAAFARIALLDRTLSDYDPESELMRLCARAGGPPVEVSDPLFRCLERALEMARRSEGAFDPTINPVVRLWRRAVRQRRLPDRELLERARTLVDYRLVELDRERRTVRLGKPGMKLDLGGIAKGFAADEARAVLREHGVTSALVAAAGDIVVSDPPPGESGWRVGVAPLEDPSARPEHYLILAHRAVSTSGDTERFVEIDGVRYSHIVDPRTGMGLVDRASVTVVARDATTSDALATTVAVLGPEAGLRLVEETPDAAALFVRAEPGGGRRVWETSRLAGYRARMPEPPMP